jgi:signal peptidase I
MRPTVLEGDVVLVNRLAYDCKLPLTVFSIARLGEPRRGDIVTFSSPKDGTRLIKRLVAVPGDVVKIQGGVLSVNGVSAEYSEMANVVEEVGPGIELPATRAVERLAGTSHAVQYLSSFGNARSFGPVVVPENSYFMLGDNRDNSEDSRFIGSVTRSRLIGRAERTLVSADIKGYWLPRLQRTWARLQ